MEEFVAWLSYTINFAITVHGYVHILTPRFGRLKTGVIQLLITALLLLAIWPLLLMNVIRAAIVLPLIFLAINLLYRDRFATKMAAFCLMTTVEVLSDALTWPVVALLTNTQDLAQLNSYGISVSSILGHIIYALILFIMVTLLVAMWNRRISTPLQKQEQMLTLFASTQIFAQVLFVGISTFAASRSVDAGFIATTVPLDLAAFVMLFVFLGFFRDQITQTAQIEAMRAQKNIQSRYAADMAAYAESVQSIRAQLSDSLATVRIALASGSIEQLDAFAGTYLKEARKLPHQFSDSVAVNSLVLEKQRLAEEHGILFSCHTRLDIPEISEFSLCSILSNLLDNAIEAAAHAGGKKWISINRFHKAGLTTLICSNAHTPGSVKKGISEDHGLGLSIVRTTAQRYGGTLHLEAASDRFTAIVAFLPDVDDLPKTF